MKPIKVLVDSCLIKEIKSPYIHFHTRFFELAHVPEGLSWHQTSVIVLFYIYFYSFFFSIDKATVVCLVLSWKYDAKQEIWKYINISNCVNKNGYYSMNNFSPTFNIYIVRDSKNWYTDWLQCEFMFLKTGLFLFDECNTCTWCSFILLLLFIGKSILICIVPYQSEQNVGSTKCDWLQVFYVSIYSILTFTDWCIVVLGIIYVGLKSVIF